MKGLLFIGTNIMAVNAVYACVPPWYSPKHEVELDI
jgi:hypothetical protein